MIIVRVTGILVEDGRILLLDQDVDDRSWSLPGGRVEPGEPLGDAVVREMREETGLDVRVERLLYVCDHLPVGGPHVVHMTFEVSRVGGKHGRAVRTDFHSHTVPTTSAPPCSYASTNAPILSAT